MSPHRRVNQGLGLIAASMLIAGCASVDEQTDVAATAMDSLVSVEWLMEHLDDPDLVILDCTVMIEMDGNGGFRAVNGRPNYEAGHIPGAGFADLTGDLSDGDSTLGYAVPTPERFAAVMGELGVGDDSKVVLYDANVSAWAARVWWMLRWIGFDNAALLDGGLNAWKAAGGELSTEPRAMAAKTLTPRVRPELIVERDEVFAAIDDDSVQIVDALTEEHFRGDMSMYGRPGHIPGASNVPATSLLDEDGRYRSTDELATLFSGDRGSRAITYCGGGIAASSAAFIMTRLGYEDVAVYTASLQEWAADPKNPLETGEEAGGK